METYHFLGCVLLSPQTPSPLPTQCSAGRQAPPGLAIVSLKNLLSFMFAHGCAVGVPFTFPSAGGTDSASLYSHVSRDVSSPELDSHGRAEL